MSLKRLLQTLLQTLSR